MAKIKTYPVATPAGDDLILFTDVNNADNTKNATVSSLAGAISEVSRSFVYLYKDPETPATSPITTDYSYLIFAAGEGLKTDDFTITSAVGAVTYTGETTKPFKVEGVIELADAGNNNEVTIAIDYNGTPIEVSAQTLISVNDDPMPFVGIGVLEMSTNDTIRFVAKATSGVTVTIQSVNVVISQL